MSFHNKDRNEFVTAGKKLESKIFESVTKFFKAQTSSIQTKMTARSNAWSSRVSRNMLTSSSKTSSMIRFALERTSVALTG
jgi:hypothetical protein